MRQRASKRREAFLAEYERSGSVEVAARQVGVGKSTGYAWARAFREARAESSVSFVELVRSAEKRDEPSVLVVQIGEAKIEVPRTFDRAHLREIVAALRAEQS